MPEKLTVLKKSEIAVANIPEKEYESLKLGIFIT